MAAAGCDNRFTIENEEGQRWIESLQWSAGVGGTTGVEGEENLLKDSVHVEI